MSLVSLVNLKALKWAFFYAKLNKKKTVYENFKNGYIMSLVSLVNLKALKWLIKYFKYYTIFLAVENTTFELYLVIACFYSFKTFFDPDFVSPAKHHNRITFFCKNICCFVRHFTIWTITVYYIKFIFIKHN